MTKKRGDEMYEVVAEVIHEVVIPELEKIHGCIENMEEKMATREDIDRIERKIDAHQKRMDSHGEYIEKHEKDIKKIKTKLSLA